MAKADPPNWDALYQIGKTAALSGQRLDRAEEVPQGATWGTPPAPRALRSPTPTSVSGRSTRRRGDKAAARAAYQEALKLDPRLEDAKKALASLG